MAFPASIKVALISTGVLSAAVILKQSVPLVTDFAASELPLMYRFVNSWLQPPYLYLIINFIIITIVASSKLQVQDSATADADDPSQPPSEQPELVIPPPPMVFPAADEKSPVEMEIRSADDLFVSGGGGVVASGYSYQDLNETVADEKLPAEMEIRSTDDLFVSGGGGVVASGYSYQDLNETVADEKIPVEMEIRSTDDLFVSGGGVVVASGYSYQDLNETVEKVEPVVEDTVPLESSERVPQRTDSLELLFQKFEEKKEKEKPLVSARFRKPAKSPTPEGGRVAALGVSKPKRHDTLETTWKTITDGRSIPLARHLKKSDTWDAPPPPPPAPAPSKMMKSETFSSERDDKPKSSLSSQGSGKLKKDPSLSQDELNRRVEAFIKKFNEEMRLQRQESLNQYQEMISGGAY